MMSLAAVALASIIACLSEPEPESVLFITEKVAGTTRSSRPRSSSLRDLPLREAFLDRSRLKILRKKFNDIVREPFKVYESANNTQNNN